MMAGRRSPMARKQRSSDGQSGLLTPDDAAVLDLVRENLRLLAELRGRYTSAGRGGGNTAVARMAELFRDAIVANAPNVILVHNHPSGDSGPSPEDVRLTKDAA